MAQPSETSPVAPHPTAVAHPPQVNMDRQSGDHGPGELDWSALHAEDSMAGGKIGRLLAGMFLLLLALMIATTLWTFWNQNISNDPHATKMIDLLSVPAGP